ncbi:MAG TPA: pitrilysin family protein [Polyangiaceae bacterium]|nr:pitrilysin family protein [Polyangiaceae bacterium]
MSRVLHGKVRGWSAAFRVGLLGAWAVGAQACGGGVAPAPPPPVPTAVPVASVAPPPPDPLGLRPEVSEPPAFLPPSPSTFRASNGVEVWLLERHEAPIVSCDMTVPTGASSDPKGKGGLAYVTANMLDEGAGKRGAIDLARALDDLGASLHTDANADASFVSITVLRRNVEPAFALFGDVVIRPRFDPAEFRRVKDLWHNELLEREKDPNATARVVFRATLFGADHPYGHPWDGTPQSAKSIGVEDARLFYGSAWRPDRAKLVCVGDITAEALTQLVESAFKSWRAPATAAPAPIAPPAPKGPWPRLVLVDRPDAPQAVIAVLRPGIAASDAEEPVLFRTNDAIGGSFSSRLNQDLRERHGYTYGARSVFSRSRGPGLVVSMANVVTDKTGDALAAMLEDLKQFASGGLTEDEVERSRSIARGELVGSYESVESIAARLAADVSLGLPPDWEAKASEKRDHAQKTELDALARTFFDPTDAVVVVVGPRARVQPMLEKLGLPAPEIRDAVGMPVK